MEILLIHKDSFIVRMYLGYKINIKILHAFEMTMLKKLHK